MVVHDGDDQQVDPESEITEPELEQVPAIPTDFGLTGELGHLPVVPWAQISLASQPLIENRLVIPLVVCGAATQALVDTGAASSMVSLSWVREHGVAFSRVDHRTICGFGVGSMLQVVGVVTLQVRVPGLFLESLKLQVIDSLPSVSVQFIFAVDFL